MYIFVDNANLIITRAGLGFRGLYLECLVYGRRFMTCSVCVLLLLVMLRVCWFSVLGLGGVRKGVGFGCLVWIRPEP